MWSARQSLAPPLNKETGLTAGWIQHPAIKDSELLLRRRSRAGVLLRFFLCALLSLRFDVGSGHGVMNRHLVALLDVATGFRVRIPRELPSVFPFLNGDH